MEPKSGMKKGNFNNGFLYAVGAVLCFSVIGILGALIYQGGANPLTILIGRSFIAGTLFFLTLFVLKRGLLRVEKKDVGKLFLHSCILAVHLIVWWQGMKVLGHIPTVYAVFFTFPLFVCLISMIFLKEKISKRKVLSLVLGVIGVLFTIQFLPVLSLTGINLMGVGLMLSASLIWAVYMLFGQVLLKRYDPLTILFYNFLFCLIIFYFSQSPSITLNQLTPSVIGYIVSLGVISTYLGYLFYYFAIKNLGASTMSILNLAVPFLTTLLAFLVLKQTITLFQFSGMVLIISGVYLLYREKKESGK